MIYVGCQIICYFLKVERNMEIKRWLKTALKLYMYLCLEIKILNSLYIFILAKYILSNTAKSVQQ